MSCERVNELADVAAGTPPSAELRGHLEGCSHCREALDELRRSLALAGERLAPLASEEPSLALRARIREAVADQGVAVGTPARKWAWGFAAAAFVLLALATALASRGLRPTRTTGAVAQASPAAAVAPARVEPFASAPITSHAEPGPAAAALPGAAARRGSTPAALLPPAVPRARRTLVAAGPRGEPEVLVPAGEEERLLRLVAILHGTTSPDRALLTSGEPSPELAGPSEIEIEPLEIVPLDAAPREGTS